MPDFVIHIGPHKTGSTYLQGAFRALRPQLLERGIYYPEQWQGPDKLQHSRIVSLLRAGSEEDLRAEFELLKSSSHETILISTEGLSELKGEEIKKLRRLLGDVPTRIVFYCRRWSELLASGWQELVKHGHTMTLPELLYRSLVNPFGSHTLNYSRTLRRYAEFFDLSNISLAPYSHIRDNGEDIFAHFCRNFLKWEEPPKPPVARANVSLPPVQVELIRAINAIELAVTGNRTNQVPAKDRVRIADIKLITDINTTLITDQMQKYVVHAQFNERVEPLLRLHKEIANEFGSCLVEPHEGSWLFVPKLSELPYVRQDYLLSPGIASSLLDLRNKIIEQT